MLIAALCFQRDKRYVYGICIMLTKEKPYAALSFTEGESYWAVQAALLSSLTFTRHRLSPLSAFTSGAYVLHNGKRILHCQL